MNTILVWILVSIGGYNSNQVAYSPPMADLASCQRMQSTVAIAAYRSSCVQVAIVVK